VQEANEEFYGTLKIGIIPTIAPFILPHILPKILSKYPKVDFRIYEITTNDIVKRIKLRELDVGVLSTPLKDEALVEQKLFVEDFMVYDASGTRKNNSKYHIEDIDTSKLWLLEESHCMANQIGQICHLKKLENFHSNLTFSSGSILSLLEVVHSNKGITLLPRLATLNEQLINPDFLFPIYNPVPAREIGLVTYKNFMKKKLLSILADEINLAIKPKLPKRQKQDIIKPFDQSALSI
jgi:LysR family hydrogen peroxide-inducible transcriptional activator